MQIPQRLRPVLVGSVLAGRVTAALLAFVVTTGSALAAETGQVARVNGIDVFYGVIPGEILSGHPAAHVERKMHGGVPRGSGQHHLVVSLFDVETGQRIENAKVSASVGEPGLAPQSKNLEPMQFAGTVTYGSFFTMTGPGPYRIEVAVTRSGDLKPAQAVFEYRQSNR